MYRLLAGILNVTEYINTNWAIMFLNRNKKSYFVFICYYIEAMMI